MKSLHKSIYKNAFYLLLFFFSISLSDSFAQCDPSTPSFTLDLSGSPNATSVTPTSTRNGTCCNGSVPCTKIVVLLHPNAMALMLMPTGADPGGALTYEFNCDGIQIPGGTPVCLSGTGPQTLTICKVGNNPNAYSVTSVPKPNIPDSVFVRSGCTQSLAATGFSVPTINWTAVNAGTNTALFNSYLSCTVGCATVTVTPNGTVPVSYVDYKVSGVGAAPCETNFYTDTVRVYFYNDLVAPMSPTTICFGSVSAVLSPTPSGGKPPYTYTWSTSSNSPSITVGPGNYTLFLSDNTGCPPITSTVTVSQFTVAITANPGPTLSVCKGPPTPVPLSGTVTAASGGIWSGGTGTFIPSNTVLATNYLPTSAEISSGSVQLTLTSTGNQGCPPGTGTTSIGFQNPPLVNAGTDKTVCANNNLVTLSGTVSGYPATVIWSSMGTGTFASVTNSNTTYTPSAADITATTVNIVLTSTNNGACQPAKDTVKVFITPKPIVNAGTDQLICSTQTAALNGTVSAATTSGVWTSLGNGTFAPNSTNLSTGYIPGSNDITTGSVNIVLTSTNNGNCLAERDTVKINIRKLAIVNAGLNQFLCSTAASINLSGSVTGGTTTGIWSSSGTGNFNPSNTNLITSYSITPADVTNGSVIFTLTSTNNGPCPAVNDSVLIKIKELAIVNAGINQLICSNQNTIALLGTVTGSPGSGNWSSSTGGAFIPASTNLNASYSITASDITLGNVTLTLTSTNNGVCPAVSDTVKMKITKLAIVNAGLNQFLCSTTPSVSLSGSVTGAGATGIWSSSGTGNFSPSNTNLLTSYSMTPADITNGSVIFTLTSTNNGPCPAVNDSVLIKLKELAIVNAGINQSVCSNQNTIALLGTVTGSPGTGNWSSGTGGAFIPASSNLNASYSITATDIALGTVTLTLTSTNNGVCPAVSDTVKMKITKITTVTAAADQNLCSITPTIALSGTVNPTAIGGNWTSSGGGSYVPGSSSLITVYSVTPADVSIGVINFTLSSGNNGPCPTVTDFLQVNFFNIAVVNSGPNQSLCSSSNNIQLNGSVLGASGTGSWTANGSGSFNPSATDLNATYSMSATDITNGSVTFTLSSTSNSVCPLVKDTVKMKITQLANVNAGLDQAVCSNQNSVSLSGTITSSAGTGLWSSSGLGSFSPAASSLNTKYVLSPSDAANGTVLLTLESTNNGPCPTVKDTLRTNISTPAQVSAGPSQTVCSTVPFINLAGNILAGSGTGIWTTNGSGTFTPNSSVLTAIYTISSGDLLMGSLNFNLTSTNNGACPAGLSQNQLIIRNTPTVNAGPDNIICTTTPIVTLNGVVLGSTNTGNWTTNGSGIFIPGANVANTSYSISASDINNGTVRFILTSTNNDVCSADADTLKLDIIKNPQVSVASQTIICEKQSPVFINGQINGGSGDIKWLSSGKGSFKPNDHTIPVYYYIASQDVTTGSLVITLSSVNNGPCGNVSSYMNMNVLPSAHADFIAKPNPAYLLKDAVVFTNISSAANTYSWYLGDGESTTQAEPVHMYDKVGFYTVTLIANNDHNCSDTSQHVITVISEIKFPNAFTPDPKHSNGGTYTMNDLSNDVFFPYTFGVTEYEMMIFNRWGELIFRTNDINTGWDGYFDGKICQQDTYVWKINMKFFDGRTYNGTGSVTLLR